MSAARICWLAVSIFFRGSIGFTGSIWADALGAGLGKDLVKSRVIILDGFSLGSITAAIG